MRSCCSVQFKKKISYIRDSASKFQQKNTGVKKVKCVCLLICENRTSFDLNF